MLTQIKTDQLCSHLIAGKALIDFRSPQEFLRGSIPGAVNLPILNDAEYAEVGTAYKLQGPENATLLGYHLVSGKIKADRVAGWLDFLKENPEAIGYCFRGGQRSHIARKWIWEAGCDLPTLEGGFKKSRQFFINYLNQFLNKNSFLVLAGNTGSGKSVLLRQIEGLYPIVDLEKRANHRGSAFGGLGLQPSQVDFENQLVLDFIHYKHQKYSASLLLEDESRLLGRRALPDPLFQALRRSPVVLVKRSFEQRVQQIYQEYIEEALHPRDEVKNKNTFDSYKHSLNLIQKKLGGARYQEITKTFEDSLIRYYQGDIQAHKNWIQELLVYYYDPMYESSLKKRNPEVIFQGSHSEIIDFLKHRMPQRP